MTADCWRVIWSKADIKSNFCSYQGISDVRLNNPAAPKVLPWQQDGNWDNNAFMALATWGCRVCSQGRALHPEPDVSGQNHFTKDRSGILKSSGTDELVDKGDELEKWGGVEREKKKKKTMSAKELEWCFSEKLMDFKKLSLRSGTTTNNYQMKDIPFCNNAEIERAWYIQATLLTLEQ